VKHHPSQTGRPTIPRIFRWSARTFLPAQTARLRLIAIPGLAIAITCSLFFRSGQAVGLTNFSVTNTNDSGAGSLREAIEQANTNATDDTIDFALPGCNSTTPCTISLTSGELLIANNGTLTITGPGAEALSVSGNNLSRVFNVSPGAIVTISDLKITGGRTGNGAASVVTGASGQDGTNGGGIYNDGGTLTVNNCNISGNVTGNGGNGGPSGSAGSGVPGGTGGQGGRGAGVYNNTGVLTLNNTTVSGNTAGNGGPGGGGAQNGGRGGDGGKGAGIYSLNGSLTLTNSTFSGNNAGSGGPGVSAGFNGGSGGTGGDGGGLYADGSSPTLTNSTFSNNRAGNGGTGAQGSSGNAGGFGGVGGSGGGIYNNGGTLTLSSSTVNANFSGTGANAGFGTFQSGAGGPGGNGAGVFCANTTLNVDGGSIDSNRTGNGGSATGNSFSGSNGGNGGSGSGVYFNGGTATLTNLTLRSNVTLNGGNASNGAFGGAPGGTGGDGSGLYINAGTVTIGSSAIYSNTTGNGGLGVLGGGGGAGGFGAGVYNRGTLTVVNTTISGNAGGNGNNGQASNGSASGGAGGSGAGIYNFGTLKTINVTVAGNASGTAASGGSSGTGGGIVKSFAGTAHLRNTIVSGNTAQFEPDVSGQFVSDGHNFIGKNGGSGFTNGVNGNQVGTTASPKDPQLGPLQNNGGPTQTLLLPPASLAFDAGDNCVLTLNGCGDNNPAVTTDQRGLTRAQGANVDIGAVEAILQIPNAPDLLSDTGISSTDNITNATNLQFQVSGGIPNGTVELLRDGTVVASATADGSGVALLSYTDNAADGNHNFAARNSISGVAGSNSSTLVVTIDRTAPTVTINQAGGQADPTHLLAINFTVIFSEAVNGFTNGGISLTGSTADVSAASINVTGSGTNYNVAVSNLLGSGLLQAAVIQNAAQDTAGNSNAASTSSDNTVLFDNIPPSITIEQAAAQTDPTSTLPITFSVVFSEPVSGFANGDVSLTGSTANVSSASINVTGSGANYTVAVNNVTSSGTVVASIPSGVAADAAGNLNTASTSSDNSVTFNLPVNVTINQAAGQADPTKTQPINFIVVFSESVTGFSSSGVSLAGSTANVSAANINVSGSGTTYNVAVSNVISDGVVQAAVLANAASDFENVFNSASNSTDNSVTLDTTGATVTIEQASGQVDPTTALPVTFTVAFNEPVTGFTGSDISLAGSTADLSLATVTVSGSGANYTVNVNGLRGSGSVQASIPAGVALDAAGNLNQASTSTDNTVTFTETTTSLTINVPGDAGDGVCDATCTLRDAITTANTTPGTKNIGFNLPGCTTGSPCTITLTGGVLQPTNGPVVINGPGANILSISGNNSSRIFLVNDNVGLSLSGLTLTNGRAPGGAHGGAILNQGALSLTSSAVAASAAGYGGDGGSNGSPGGPGGNGGGIASSGTLTVVRSTISGNFAGSGGTGAFNLNGPPGGNGGLGGSGGGIWNNGGALTLINSTVSNNSAGSGGTGGFAQNVSHGGNGGTGGDGGGVSSSGVLVLINTTVANNNAGNAGNGGVGCGGCGDQNTYHGLPGAAGKGGGIATSAGNVKLRNVVLGLNNAANGPDVWGTFISSGHNFVGRSDGGTGFTDGVNGDQAGTIASPKDPLLGPLQNNGGPTMTRSPLAGSPMRDAGDNCVFLANGCGDNNSAIVTDQRGATRPGGSVVDIGSVEAAPIPNAPDLLATSDTGVSDSDNLTKETNLQFSISGAVANATVELLRNGSVVASGTADGSGSATLSYTDNSADGLYNFTCRQTSAGSLSEPSASLPVTIDRTGPTVTINQASGQADPTSAAPINFTAVFNQPVTGFSNAGISLAGSTADTSAATVNVTGSGTTYNVSVANLLSSGTVRASVLANAITDDAGNGSQASTSTDNTVTFNIPAVTVTINQAAGQADPTESLPINFTVVFSVPVTGFSSSGVSLAGSTANVSSVTITVTGSGATYNVAVGNVTGDGTVQASVAANSASGLGGSNLASTSTDNSVTFQGTPPTVAINQAAGQSDPATTQPINFTVVFNKDVNGFSSNGVSLAGSTANVSAASINISGSGTTYNVAVGNIQSAGTVQASVLANAATGLGGGNQASTSSDNTVTFQAPMFTVNQTNDQGDGVCDATCTLRDAIGTANNTPGPKTINFDLPSCTALSPCTITYPYSGQATALLIDNNGSLNIAGPGVDVLKLNGNVGNSTPTRVLRIANGATVDISDLTITGGSPPLSLDDIDGGAIYNEGNLTLTRVNLSGNRASFGAGGGFCSCNAPGNPAGKGGAIYNTGSLTLNSCTLTSNAGGRGGQGGGTFTLTGGGAGSTGGDGGAIYNAGTLNVLSSTFDNNAAGAGGFGGASTSNVQRGSAGNGGNGGAIYSTGTLTIVNSTFSTNQTPNGVNGGSNGNGGSAGNGGAIFNAGGNALVINTTVANNSVGNAGVKGVNGTTNGVNGAAGGIDISIGTIKLRNTIVALNTVPAGASGPDLLGVFTSLGHNFIGKSDGGSGFTDAFNFDQVGSIASPKDPLLGSLMNNGGRTFTLNLAANSPAKDAGDNCVLNKSCSTSNLLFNLTTDQRGFTRPQFTAVDIGAVEYATPPTVTINQAAGQADPVHAQPINFTVVFSRAVTGLSSAGVSLAGSTANVASADINVTGSGTTYNVAVSNLGDGIVQASIPAGTAMDSDGIANDASTSTDNTVTLDAPPTVTINQAASQADPTGQQPINFTVVFNETVTGLTGSAISLAGSTADVSAAQVSVTGSGTTYNVAVSNILTSGVVQASITANGAVDTGGNGSLASTSADNSVTVDITRPLVTINQANGQPDPTGSEPINFSVLFTEPVTGFTNAGVSLIGSTADVSSALITVSGSGANYTVSVSNLLSAGIVQASIPANSAIDSAGNGNTVSTSADNTVTYAPATTNLVVNQTGDPGDGVCDATCTLRDAITTANSTPGIKNISFNLPSCNSGSPCTITLSNGELTVANNGVVRLTGPGANVLIVSGNNQSRIFRVSPSAFLNASGLTLTGGFSGNGANGGTANNGFGDGLPGGDGQSGGAIYNQGSLALTDCIVISSRTGNGGNGGNGGPDGNPRPGGAGGAGGLGGGIYSTGNLTLNNCTFNGNTTGNGGTGGIGVSGSSSGSGGAGGSGGGVYSSGILNVSNTTSSNNTTGNGGNGADANGFTFSGSGGAGGSGAGIFGSGALNVRSSTVSGNHAGSGGTGGVNSGHNNGATGGSGGKGAGIFSSGPFVLTNSTVTDNVAGAGNFGGYAITFGSCPCGSDGAGGNGGSGGGIYSPGSATLVNNTISNNTAGAGGGGVANPFGGNGSPGSAGNGGGIAVGAGTASIRNTIVYANAVAAGGSGTQGFGTFVSLGHNLFGDPSGASGFGAAGDLLNTNPLLGALQNNGGPTQTRNIDVNSPAKNSGDNCVLNRSCASVNLDLNLVVDQRGINRPQGSTVDIGAVEFSLSSSQTSLTSSQNPSQLNQTVTFTASVTSGAGSPTGTVQFLDGATPISGCTSVALASGQATCQTSSLALGDHTITADYNGDGNFNPSSGSLTGNPQVVNKITPTFGLTSSVNPSVFAQQVSFTATLSSSSGTPDGTVQFLDGLNPISGCNSVNLANGQAVCLTSALSVASHTISAQYSGNASFNSATVDLTGTPQVVNKANVTVGVTSSLNPSVRGDQVTFTATISASSGIPTGTVQFLDAGNPINGCSSASVSSGQATCQTSDLELGSHTISVQYSGDGNFNGQSASLSGPQVVNPVQATFVLASAPNPSFTISAVTLTATLTPATAPPQPASGSVTFKDGSNNISNCTALTLTAGQAQCIVPGNTFSSGSHNLTAEYSGDLNFGAANSNTVVQQVDNCATNQTVTDPGDSGPNTLRQALIETCDGGTINFNLGSGPHTITLASELSISRSVTIVNTLSAGNGPVTINGNNATRVFNVLSGATVAMVNLTLTGGNGSGGDGGAIENSGTLTLAGVTLNGNAASNGGAIRNDGSLTILNSTLPGNSAAQDGGAIFNGAAHSLTLTNVTVTGNSATQNGGGIANNGIASLGNTIIAGNSATTSAPDIFGSFTSLGHNLVGKSDGAGGFSNGVNGDQVGTIAAPTDPLLRALADNGGGAFTHSPLPGSPVIDAGNNALLPTDALDLDGDSDVGEPLPLDQRGSGFARIINSTVDIGAVEVNYTIAATSGSGQSSTINTAFATLLEATVKESGIDQNGISVIFTPPASGATGSFASSATITTDASGVARAPAFTANGIAGGPYNVVGSLAGGSLSANFALTNTAANQTISISTHAPAQASFNDSFTVAGTSSSGLPVGYSSSGNCTNLGATFTINSGNGVCTVTYSQAGDGNFNAAPPVIESVNAQRANQTINFAGLSDRAFNGPDFTVSATATSNLAVSFTASGQCTINGATVHLTGAGSCTIAAHQAGDNDFNAATDVPQSFNIGKANQTISFGSLQDRSFGDADFAVSATATSNLAVSFTASGQCTINGATVHLTGAGSCTIAAHQAGDNDFNAAADVPQAFNIGKANQTISFGTLQDRAFGDGDFAVSATATSNLAVTFTATGSCAVTGSTVHLSGAGSCTITAHQAGDNDFNAAADVSQTFNISKASQTISFGTLQDRTFGDADFTVSATATSNLAVSFTATGSCAVTGSTIQLTGAGSCTITAHQPGDNNFNAAADVPQPFNISKANQTITFGSLQDRSFADPDFAVSATAISNLAVSFTASGQCTINGVTVHLTGAGSCTITAHQPGDNNFNAATDVPQAFNISKANQTISFGSLQTRTFGDADFAVSATATSNLAVSFTASGQCTINGVTVHLNGAGSCTITAHQGGDNNFNAATDVPQAFNISKASQTISFGSLQDRTFGDADFAASATATSNLAVSFNASGQCTINGATVHLTGAGSCTITAHQGGDNNFNAAADLPQAFNISKANQTISFGSLQDRTFGDADFAVSATATSNLAVSFKARGQCTINGATVHLTGAGSCTITASQSGDSSFASAPDVTQTFNIAKANTTIAVNSSNNPASLGQSVTFTATAAGPAGAAIPTGAVQLKDNGANLGSPQSLNASGVATLMTSSLTGGNHTITADYIGDVNFNPNAGTLAGGQTITNQPLISFSQSNYLVNESQGFVRIVVNRSGDTTAALSLDYVTSDAGASGLCSALNTGLASSQCDFTMMLGTLRFAANQTQQTLDIPVNQDSFAESPEVFTVVLSNLTGGASFVTSASATVTISDSAAPAPNAIDDTEMFVRQQYHDFLNRDADPAGLAFWKNNIDQCKAPGGAAGFSSIAHCLEVMRISTSASFFLSIEFQATGNLVRSFYVAALDRPATNNMPAFSEFEQDTQAIQRDVIVGQANWQQQLDANRIAFMNDFVTRAEFVGLYPTTDTPAQYVDKLYLHASVTPTIQERLDAISEFGGAATAADTVARGRALLLITQHPAFQARELNRSFVQMQYFGYLRRNPNDAPDGNFNGYDFWLNKLKAADGNFITSEMVKAFFNSIEYRRRFGP